MLIAGLLAIGGEVLARWLPRGGRLVAAAAGAATAAECAAAAAPASVVELPCGIDRAALLAAARDQFVRLQAAWDAGDVALLGELTTPALWRELCEGLPATPGARTDVLTLDARLVDFHDASHAWIASVEFSGMMREAADTGAAPFREWWVLAGDKGAGGEVHWRLALQQTLL